MTLLLPDIMPTLETGRMGCMSVHISFPSVTLKVRSPYTGCGTGFGLFFAAAKLLLPPPVSLSFSLSFSLAPFLRRRILSTAFLLVDSFSMEATAFAIVALAEEEEEEEEGEGS
jgi:hypothetical protein